MFFINLQVGNGRKKLFSQNKLFPPWVIQQNPFPPPKFVPSLAPKKIFTPRIQGEEDTMSNFSTHKGYKINLNNNFFDPKKPKFVVKQSQYGPGNYKNLGFSISQKWGAALPSTHEPNTLGQYSMVMSLSHNKCDDILK